LKIIVWGKTRAGTKNEMISLLRVGTVGEMISFGSYFPTAWDWKEDFWQGKNEMISSSDEGARACKRTTQRSRASLT
jgi:hypothetical protein